MQKGLVDEAARIQAEMDAVEAQQLAQMPKNKTNFLSDLNKRNRNFPIAELLRRPRAPAAASQKEDEFDPFTRKPTFSRSGKNK